jgi:hypothetical protein
MNLEQMITICEELDTEMAEKVKVATRDLPLTTNGVTLGNAFLWNLDNVDYWIEWNRTFNSYIEGSEAANW